MIIVVKFQYAIKAEDRKDFTELLILKEISEIWRRKLFRIERDPNRNVFIALVKYKDNELRYILCPNKLEVGDKIIASENAEIKIGNALALKIFQ